MSNILEKFHVNFISPDNIMQCIRSLSIIYDYVYEKNKILREFISDFNNKKSSLDEILFFIRCITSEIYSGCEIINELFISIYRNDVRYRGSNLLNGYNKNFLKIYKAHIDENKLKGVHSDKILYDFYLNSTEWYVIIHDISHWEE